MPQMSPLVWVGLMSFFVLCYLILSILIYYEVYQGDFKCKEVASIKFFILF